MKRWIAIAALLLVLIAAYLLYHRMYGGETVRVVKVKSGTVRESIEEQAVTALPRTYQITMPFDGRLKPIELTPGTKVNAGDAIARIDERDLQLHLQQAEAEVARLEASIRENDDSSLESIGLKQAENFVTAMTETVKAAAAQMTSGREKLAVSSRYLERIKKLYESNAATLDRLDQAQLDEVDSNVQYEQDRLIYNAARAIETAAEYLPKLIQQSIDNKKLKREVLDQELLAAKSALEQAKIQQERGTLVSPVDGVVLERFIDSEQTLPLGTELLQIGRMEELRVEADILTQEATRIRTGDKVEIFGTALGAEPAQGEVQEVYPAGFAKISSLGVEQQRVKTVINFAEGELARLAKQRSLGVAYRVNVRIFTQSQENALWIPRTSVFRSSQGRWQAFAVRGGKLELVTLKVGLLNENQVEVTQGLALDEMVVISPGSDLNPGKRVQAEETED